MHARSFDGFRFCDICLSVWCAGMRWDNTSAESFDVTFKNEGVRRMVYPAKAGTVKNMAL